MYICGEREGGSAISREGERQQCKSYLSSYHLLSVVCEYLFEQTNKCWLARYEVIGTWDAQRRERMRNFHQITSYVFTENARRLQRGGCPSKVNICTQKLRHIYTILDFFFPTVWHIFYPPSPPFRFNLTAVAPKRKSVKFSVRLTVAPRANCLLKWNSSVEIEVKSR